MASLDEPGRKGRRGRMEGAAWGHRDRQGIADGMEGAARGLRDHQGSADEQGRMEGAAWDRRGRQDAQEDPGAPGHRARLDVMVRPSKGLRDEMVQWDPRGTVGKRDHKGHKGAMARDAKGEMDRQGRGDALEIQGRYRTFMFSLKP